MSAAQQPMQVDFHFDVDEEYARKHNEFLRDAKRMQVSAGVLAAVLIVIVAVLLITAGSQWWALAISFALGVFALLCLILIPVLPRKMGSPQQYFDMYQLAPAMIAEVNARDMVLLMLVDASTEPAKTVPALAYRTVTSVPGVPREVGARVPSMAVTGYRPTRGPKVYEEISPMPVAWGTGDAKVWKRAERAISTNLWNRLEGLLDQVDKAKQANRSVYVLEDGKADAKPASNQGGQDKQDKQDKKAKKGKK
ncbi:DUF3239 domain-containing protein [Corynebacterium jeikeium]|uniref:DUF3239 domain-containing protein n=1 Tax=Corynebacterium jeikeium TaxID=38289 RepID=UPI00089263FE|nr:DUF3239 domain-containing protein [Corynebacterium jeikeium]SCX04965.1 hypothetical protein CJBVI_0378 [Corynebacterium jeikeium]